MRMFSRTKKQSMRKALISLSFVAAFAAPLVLAPSASAAEPTVIRLAFPVHVTVTGVCDFPFTIDLQDKGTLIVFTDEAGNVTRVAIQFVGMGTVTNDVTGKTLETFFAKLETVNYEAGTFTQVGTNIRIRLPDGGEVFFNAGRLVLDVASFKPAGATVLFQAGPHPFSVEDQSVLCAALS